MSFTVTLSAVVMMLLYAIPGYIVVRRKLIRPEAISAFAMLLLYVGQPFQAIYAFQRLDFSMELIKLMILSVVLSLALMGAMLAAVYLILRKKQHDVRYRICTMATCFGNCSFMGIPLLETLMPNYPEAVAFSTMFFLSMSLLSWSVGSAIITRDVKYISLRKIFLNPAIISMAIAVGLYFARIQLPSPLDEVSTQLSKMCTPMCMLILGMRLAMAPIKPIFTDRLQYAVVGVKLIGFPLLGLAVASLLPVPHEYVQAVYILCCVPVANVVLSFSEMLGEGQETAANVVLLSTLLSVVTLPIMLLII